MFLVRPEETDGAAARASLPPDDQEHVARFHFAADRAQHLASRSLQRRALSACAPVAPPVAPIDWRFRAGRHGKPAIAAPILVEPLAFNVANTRGLVGCAVTAGTRELGLDLEPWRDDAPNDLVAKCFTAAERAGLARQPAAGQARRFIELWTVKEAYLKARGLGLDPPLELIDVVLDEGEPFLRLDPALGDDAARWQLALWAPTATHCAAVCVQRGDAPLTITRRWA